MTAFWIAALCVLQIGGFYMIALLYVRISKLDKTEKNQQQLMKEMEDSLALYITEVKEENDRLIDQFIKIQQNQQTTEMKDEAKRSPILQEDEVAATAVYFNPLPPTSKVLDSYRTQQQASVTNTVEPIMEPKQETEFETVYRLQSEGLSIGAIASRLKKGKTEVELILKFKR
ncbi:hypothetical protein DVB69_02945 [Sporosarcina sp. BI001-red]|uniref:hypothetical protein n=1 Tax=Sporosarcina sp. BI001-red TaxID=2282866 RepID=UPI000E2608AE|nr:hypothetical protein [Sporosarcina sp. BI001-red]REB09779.1 hypothetical protein DVB69_02945 [Sporosarcina sp. BI001-red]